MRFKTRLSGVLAGLTAAVLAACAISKVKDIAYPPQGNAPIIVMVDGWNETAGNGHLHPLAEALRAKGYDVREYAEDSLPDTSALNPIAFIGFSYGADSICLRSFTQPMSLVILINPVVHGSVWCQGRRIEAGRIQQIDLFVSDDLFPRASSSVHLPNGQVVRGYLVKGCGHVGLINKISGTILNLFDNH